MSEGLQIRTVTVELLRSGPAHNQLLSPLTQYLGICDDSEAGVVTLPFEHASFLRRMKSMRYVAGIDEDGRTDRLPILRELGVDMARLLGTIPRLSGSLSAQEGSSDTLVHLRMVLSASELAALPFEQAKMPIGPTSCGEDWLSLQVRTPVVVTRRTRNVSEGGVDWPVQPRILFISADPDDVPFEEHKQVLLDAIGPFLRPGDEEPKLRGEHREEFGDLLTILRGATFADVMDECSTHRYTHIHVLAHGAEDPATEERSYGLALKRGDGRPDVISGDRLASAFTCLIDGSIHRPAVVVLATCDSANEAAVMTPGASIAHVLHQAGVAMVVASQYPLSKVGSVHLTKELYGGLLRGDDPWILLHRIRTGLHGHVMGHSHDWASLVVYEALPTDLTEALEDVRYHQHDRAMKMALERIDQAVAASATSDREPDVEMLRHHQRAMQDAADQLPIDGRFMTECFGLRASSKKRLAEAEFNIARHCTGPDARRRHVDSSLGYLDEALDDYTQAVDSILVSRGAQVVQRVASLHWVLVQRLCLSAVLADDDLDREGAWETARMSAEAYLKLNEIDQCAWAHGSLIELWLLKLTDNRFTEDELAEAWDRALDHANQLSRMYHSRDAFPIQSTRRQLERYATWWSDDLIEVVVSERLPGYPTWRSLGVVDLAEQLMRVLDTRSTVARSAEPERPAPSAATAEPDPETISDGAEATAKMATTEPTPPSRPAQDSTAQSRFTINMLPARHGDCLWIEYGEGDDIHRVLIDCGTESAWKFLKPRIAALPSDQRHFDLFILTHIDDDHIGGAIPLLQDEELGVTFGDIWFNGWKHFRPGDDERLGAAQGEIFSGLIKKHGHPWNEWRDNGAIVLLDDNAPYELPGGMTLTLLSPNRTKLDRLRRKWQKDIEELDEKKPDEDWAVGEAPVRRLGGIARPVIDIDALADAKFKPDGTPHNGSSIAVLAEYGGRRALLAGDAHAPLLVESIELLVGQGERLELDVFKVPHHGSQKNVSRELIELLDCEHYLISTNGGSYDHPDASAIARIIKYGDGPKLWFNYTNETILSGELRGGGAKYDWSDARLQRGEYPFDLVFPPDDEVGQSLALFPDSDEDG